MKKDWKNFVSDLESPDESKTTDEFSVVFLHRDEFKSEHDLKNAKFPSAYVETDKGLELFINQDELNAVKSIDELKDLVNNKIKEFQL